MDSKIVKKFFNNQATPEETQNVLEWFETSEGKQYLLERLDVDADLMDRRELRNLVPELDSGKLFDSITYDIRKKNNVFSIRRNDWLGYTVKAAATILVILIASFFAITQQRYEAEQVVESEPVLFQTENEQHRDITLGDGTIVRMNSNSEMIVSEDFMHGNREITLTGEAYFDVAHNPEEPFIVHTNQSTVEVLGTAFNVRSIAEENNVQVAVVEGRVSFKNTLAANSNDLNAILSKGQYGYLDISERTILVDDLAVENYLVWKSGGLKFENLSLSQVCTQLNRLYDISCSYEDSKIENLQLTANFSAESIEKTLSVIGLSLEIEFEKADDRVHWSHER